MTSHPAAGAHDPLLLDRVLGTAPAPRDAATRAAAGLLARQAQQVPLPPASLTGWASLCAGEYAEAVAALQRAIGAAIGALASAAGADG